MFISLSLPTWFHAVAVFLTAAYAPAPPVEIVASFPASTEIVAGMKVTMFGDVAGEVLSVAPVSAGSGKSENLVSATIGIAPQYRPLAQRRLSALVVSSMYWNKERVSQGRVVELVPQGEVRRDKESRDIHIKGYESFEALWSRNVAG